MKKCILFVLVIVVHCDYLCNQDEAEKAIRELHDDLDDDDDGTISTKENNAFNDEYGISSGSISALINDKDGRVSATEFLDSWRHSEVYKWMPEDVVKWLKTPDLKLRSSAVEELSKMVLKHNISGRCFPLISSSDELLKQIGIRQHLVRRKLMLKAMDAILFGPPIYDSTLKDFALAFFMVVALVSVVWIINLRRENAKFEARLEQENERIANLDSRWKEFTDENSAPTGDTDSSSTVDQESDDERHADYGQLRELKKQKDQLIKSLDEAHKELRSFQSGRGGTGQSIQVTSELKVLMRKCYEWEKDGLKYRKEDAFKMQASAKEAYHGLERENKTFLGAIRLVHSPTKLSSFDQSIREAALALETVTAWQKDFHSRWRDIERLCSISIRERAASSRDAFRESKSSPQFSTISGSDHESTTTAVRQLTDDSPTNAPSSSRGLHHRHPRHINQLTESGRASSSGFHSNSSSNTNSRPPARNNSSISIDKNRNAGIQAFPNSIETNSISSNGSHIKTKSGSLLKPVTRFLRFSKRDKKKKENSKLASSTSVSRK